MPIADDPNQRQSFTLPPIEAREDPAAPPRREEYENQQQLKYSSAPDKQAHISTPQTSADNMTSTSSVYPSQASHRYQPTHYSPQPSTRYPSQQHHHSMPHSSAAPSPVEAPRRAFNVEDREYASSQQPARPFLPSIKEALNQAPAVSRQQPPPPNRQQTSEYAPAPHRLSQQQKQPPMASPHSPIPSRKVHQYGSQSNEGSYPRARSPYNGHLTPVSPEMDGAYTHEPSTARTTNRTAPPLSSLVNPSPSLAAPPNHQSSPAQNHPPPPLRQDSGHSVWSQAATNGHDERGGYTQSNGVTSRYGPTTTAAGASSSSSPLSNGPASHYPATAAEPPHDHHYRQYPDSASYSRSWRPEEREQHSPDGWRGGYGEAVVKRHLETFDLDSALNEIADGSRELLSFGSHYCQKSHNTARTGPLPGSTPHLDEIDAMMKHSTRVHDSLHRMRAVVVTQQAALVERSREQAQRSSQQSGATEHHHGFYEDSRVGGFAGADPKKRRGRAAPPGRCHSCNRAETPEWRRGPDGARTLCNACGLHYAKLTRKMGNQKASGMKMSSSNLRPKMGDDDDGSEASSSAAAAAA